MLLGNIYNSALVSGVYSNQILRPLKQGWYAGVDDPACLSPDAE